MEIIIFHAHKKYKIINFFPRSLCKNGIRKYWPRLTFKYSHALLQMPSSAVEEDLSEFSAKALAIQNMPRRNYPF